MTPLYQVVARRVGRGPWGGVCLLDCLGNVAIWLCDLGGRPGGGLREHQARDKHQPLSFFLCLSIYRLPYDRRLPSSAVLHLWKAICGPTEAELCGSS